MDDIEEKRRFVRAHATEPQRRKEKTDKIFAAFEKMLALSKCFGYIQFVLCYFFLTRF